MYILTGGAGFIGSAFLAKLNAVGISDILVVDELEKSEKWKNLNNKSFLDYIHKDDFLKQILDRRFSTRSIKAIIHLGACSSTVESDCDFLVRNNVEYSKHLAEFALEKKIRFIYASSAATYGDGAQGYSDEISKIEQLRPLNPYGFSKQLFDLWVKRNGYEKKLVGLKFFNVFGPNEYHKGAQVSVIYSAFKQIQSTGKMRLFRSYRPDVKDGEQKRDFVYVKDCCEVMWWLLNHPEVHGIFNLGTGIARSFNDLARATFEAIARPPIIEYIDMPENIRHQYQYFTQADLSSLRRVGCDINFSSLEQAAADYVQEYLKKECRYW